MFEKWWSYFSNNPLTSHNLAFSYDEAQVLRDVNLKVKKGEILAIIGKSGSGKSTFLKLVAGIIGRGYQGSIRIFGLPKMFRKHSIGFVPQEDSFIPDLSLSDNMKIMGLNSGISERRAVLRGKELLRQLMIDEPLSKLPSELSGGQRARFNIVLSLLHDPEMLIMDEPFTGLDYKNRRLLWHFISAMQKQKKSIVLTSHLLREIQDNASRIVILRKGKIFFTGNVDRLKKKLKIQYIYEARLSKLSREKYARLRKFCIIKDITVLDYYDTYVMFGLASRDLYEELQKEFSKLNISSAEISFREPNLDEVFMSS